MATVTQQGQARGDPSRNDPLDILIVGAGFAGMYMLIKARLMGVRFTAGHGKRREDVSMRK